MHEGTPAVAALQKESRTMVFRRAKERLNYLIF
jgi:hypothetical protein